jgi:mono/diheme cytochrome c family protein
MRRALLLAAPAAICVGILAVRRPLADQPPPSRIEFEKGAELFSQICSHCHGPQMVNPGNVSFDLRKFPHNDAVRFFNSVSNGKNNMPPWKDVLKPDEIKALWAYVRTGGHEP